MKIFKEVKEIHYQWIWMDWKSGKYSILTITDIWICRFFSRYNGSILFYDDLQTKFINYGDNRSDYNGIGIDGSDKYIEIDVDRDGVPDFVESNQWASDQYYKIFLLLAIPAPKPVKYSRNTNRRFCRHKVGCGQRCRNAIYIDAL